MLSTNQHYIVDQGEEIILHCQFSKTDFNLFSNPVQWYKSQFDETFELNILGNIREPFHKTGRFAVAYIAQPPRHTVVLTITSECV